MEVLNPYTGACVQTVACATVADVSRALDSAKRGFDLNRRLPIYRRAAILRDAAALVAARKQAFANCIVLESGKPITAAAMEVDRCVNTLVLAAEECSRVFGETICFDSVPGGEGRTGYYSYEPLGVVVAITPFNDPLNLVAHKLGPAIAAGNAVILKPSEQAPLSALMLVDALLEAEIPDGVINVLTGYGGEFGSALVSDPAVALISFTGGEAAATSIARWAGVKQLVMELGANSPVIVSRQARLELAADACVAGGFWASGQNCLGVQRIYVQQEVFEPFVKALCDRVQRLRTGDPRLPETDVGPMISPEDVQRVSAWVARAVAEGGRIRCGGSVLGNGCYAPTVVEVGARQVPTTAQEVFGPVVSVHSYADLADAVHMANEPDYLIHGAIFTEDIGEAMYAVSHLQCAGVMVNDSTDYRLDAMPFGGSKRGAMGREGVRFAIRQMLQTKTVCFRLVPATSGNPEGLAPALATLRLGTP